MDGKDIRENINGFIYDLMDGGDICDVCGEHYHNCDTHVDEEECPTCDNDCTNLKWSEYILGDGCGELHISVPPETDTTQIFIAFCHCEQEMIKVNGWLYDEHQLIWEGK